MLAVKLLKPSLSKALVFVFLLGIVVAGNIQAWAFSDHATPPPPFYEILSPIPVWPIAVFLLTPLLIVSTPLLYAGVDLTAMNTWYSILVVTVYLYLLGSLSVEFLNYFLRKRSAA